MPPTLHAVSQLAFGEKVIEDLMLEHRSATGSLDRRRRW